MDIKELQENIGSYLNQEVSIRGLLFVDIERNVFLSDAVLSNKFKINIDSMEFINQLEGQMTCAVGSPKIKYCDDASISGKLIGIDNRYWLEEIKALNLIFSPVETLQVV